MRRNSCRLLLLRRNSIGGSQRPGVHKFRMSIMKIGVRLCFLLKGPIIDRLYLFVGLQRFVVVGPANVEASHLGAHSPLVQNLIEVQGVVLHVDILQPESDHSDVMLIVFTVLVESEAALQCLPELIVLIGVTIVFVPAEVIPPVIQWIWAVVECNGILPGLFVLGEIVLRLRSWYKILTHVCVHVAGLTDLAGQLLGQ